MKIKNKMKSQSPAILAGLGCLGFITAAIMAAKAALKAEELLEKENYENHGLPFTHSIPWPAKIKAVAPVYAPTMGMILLSTGCIVASNRIHHYRYASLLALYSIGEKSLQKWQSAVVDEVGQKKYDKVRERTVTPDEPVPAGILLDDSRVVCFDVFSGRYFKTDSVETIRRNINDLNDRLIAGEFVSLNELYYEFGLDRVEFGDECGWLLHDHDETIKVTFDPFMKDDRPVVSISFVVKPKEY